MGKIFLFFILFISVYAQDGAKWSVIHNNREIFSATEENEQNNAITLKATDFKPGKHFIISYKATNTGRNEKEWRRVIGIYNEEDKELARKNTTALKISDGQLKKMLLENRTIKIYTWSLPKDPAEAARVRVRRVHLCTIIPE